MLVAGDFNSVPGSPAHTLLVKGKIDASMMVRAGGAGGGGVQDDRGGGWQAGWWVRRSGTDCVPNNPAAATCAASPRLRVYFDM